MEILRKMKVNNDLSLKYSIHPDYIIVILKKGKNKYFWVRNPNQDINTLQEIKYRPKLSGYFFIDENGYYRFPFYEEDLWTSLEE